MATAPKRPLPTLLPLAAFPAAALIAAVLGLDPLAGIVFIAILALGVIWHAAILRFFREPGVAASMQQCAIALAPLNTKYLIDAGALALQRHDAPGAAALFARASAIDPRASLEIRQRRGALR